MGGGLALKYAASRGAAAGCLPIAPPGPLAVAPHPSVPLPGPGFTASVRCGLDSGPAPLQAQAQPR
ncbi:MAG TPA: hypothetical protein VNK05_17505, partial [Chloroflexota bacterium]|nr:hypothetical protein [Chloroflexota bacterium]